MDGLGSHFLLANSLKRWYLVLQRSRMSRSVFEKIFNRSPLCQTLSKAFSTSRKTATIESELGVESNA